MKTINFKKSLNYESQSIQRLTKVINGACYKVINNKFYDNCPIHRLYALTKLTHAIECKTKKLINSEKIIKQNKRYKELDELRSELIVGLITDYIYLNLTKNEITELILDIVQLSENISQFEFKQEKIIC
jgi:hypothetical protein